MSIMRFSAVREVLSVPMQDGEYLETDYNRTNRMGLLGSIANYDDRNSLPDGALRNDTLDLHVKEELLRVAPKLGDDKPIVVMINGFLFDPASSAQKPRNKTDNPHKRLFSFQDGCDEDDDIKDHTSSLPLLLDFEEFDQGANGLTVAFGWDSYPGFFRSLLNHGKNFYSAAYQNARDSSWVLIAVLDSLARHLPGRKIDILCHSLGSSVAIRALAGMAKFDISSLEQMGRVVILGGSEYTGEANLMIRRLNRVSTNRNWQADKGQGPVIYNIASRENAILDLLGENFGPRGLFTDSQVVGHNGLQARKGADRWIDMQIDGGKFARWAQDAHQLTVSGDNPGNVWDHWYYYTYRPNLELYKKILRDRANWTLPALRSDGPGGPIAEGVDVGFFGD